MKNIKITEIASLVTPKLVKTVAWNKNGFPKDLDEAIRISDRKKSSEEAATSKNGFEYSDEFVNQLMSTSNQMNQAAAQGHISTGMLNLYIAQERKDEKSGRGRITALPA